MIKELKELIDKNNGIIGHYGIEREALRVDKAGRLSEIDHPNGLGDKYTNPYITTDFSESQIEMITPPFETSEKVYEFLNLLYDTVVFNIDDEYLWTQSMPCIIPDEIPVARFGELDEAKVATEYRKKLMKKYGGKKQLISGIHYNFSFDENIIKGLYEKHGEEQSYREFKDKIYLKVTRNYLRYRWLLIYLLGSTTTLHETYIDACECRKCFKKITEDSFSHEGGISYRNGECGYRNLVDLYPDYKSVQGYVDSLKDYIERGVIESHKELYSQIRLKPKNVSDFFNSLVEEGIKYLEYRTIDVNPFEPCGISLVDLRFIEIFNIFLLIKEEDLYDRWQEESLENQDLIAKFGKKTIKLKRSGEYVDKVKWALDILNEIKEISIALNRDRNREIELMKKRVKDVNLTYAHRIEERVKNKGYVDCYLSLAEKYKEMSLSKINNTKQYKHLNIQNVDKIRKNIINGEKCLQI
ncbi:MAG: hypothetical protein E6929_01005 [Clostridium sp.]|nr:hypothetical protein [Clostridium sp.]